MHAVFIGVLTSCLIPEQTFEQELAKLGVRIQQNRPSWEDNIDSINILDSDETPSNTPTKKSTPSLEISAQVLSAIEDLKVGGRTFHEYNDVADVK